MELLTALQKFPAIAILRGICPINAVAIGTILVNNGFSCIEVPLNSPDNPLLSIQLLAQEFGEKILIGAGTVIQTTEVAQVAKHGGQLIISPHMDKAIITAAKQAGLYCIAGISTPTEAFAAIAAGADALKLFPAESASPASLKALKTVLPQEIPILPVGSIHPELLLAYYQAGAGGFGLGSSIYAPGDLPSVVAQKAKAIHDAIRKLS